MSETAPKPPSKFAAWIQRNKLLSSILVVGPVFVSLLGFLNFGNYWVQHNWPRPVMLSEHKDLQKDLWKVELEHRILKKRWLQTVLSEIDRDITRLEADKKVSASTLLDQKNQIVDEIEDLQRRISELQKLVGS